jgi:hypothetical protein
MSRTGLFAGTNSDLWMMIWPFSPTIKFTNPEFKLERLPLLIIHTSRMSGYSRVKINPLIGLKDGL